MTINKRVSDEPMTHELKIYPEFFSAVVTGVKRAELRKNDRDYRVGDKLHLMETPRGSCHSTGEYINATITHIADVNEWMPGYVLLSIERELQQYRAAAEPIYQVRDWNWYDAEKHVYDEAVARGDECRVLYAAPQVTSVPGKIDLLRAHYNYGGTDFEVRAYRRVGMIAQRQRQQYRQSSCPAIPNR